MLNKNTISIYRKHTPVEEVILDYYLYFGGDGYINIPDLNQFMDHRQDFTFTIEFKVKKFPSEGFFYLMNSCIDASTNKIGVAIDKLKLYVQIDKGSGDKIEIYTPFSDTENWHTLVIENSRGELTAALDHESLTSNHEPALQLQNFTGFKIAANTKELENHQGSIDNILLTDGRDPIAQYLLNLGEGSTAKDSIGHYNGSIINALWFQKT